MRLKGMIPMSMVDWPNKLAAVLFTDGCNFRCTYCHNSELIVAKGPWLDEEEVLADLRRRRDLLDGVVITGGEPTLQPDLQQFLQKLRNDGWQIKLDSNGTDPDTLQRLIDAELVDYVAMDWKVPLSSMLVQQLIGTNLEAMEKVKRSARLLAESGVEVEWRTTCAYGIDQNALRQMERDLIGATGKSDISWYWQRYTTPDGGDRSADEGVLSKPLVKEQVDELLKEMTIPVLLRSWAL